MRRFFSGMINIFQCCIRKIIPSLYHYMQDTVYSTDKTKESNKCVFFITSICSLSVNNVSNKKLSVDVLELLPGSWFHAKYLH